MSNSTPTFSGLFLACASDERLKALNYAIRNSTVVTQDDVNRLGLKLLSHGDFWPYLILNSRELKRSDIFGTAQTLPPVRVRFIAPHSGHRVPAKLENYPGFDDKAFLIERHETHDPGTADMTKFALGKAEGSQALMTYYTRILCDLNREPFESSITHMLENGRFNGNRSPVELASEFKGGALEKFLSEDRSTALDLIEILAKDQKFIDTIYPDNVFEGKTFAEAVKTRLTKNQTIAGRIWDRIKSRIDPEKRDEIEGSPDLKRQIIQEQIDIGAIVQSIIDDSDHAIAVLKKKNKALGNKIETIVRDAVPYALQRVLDDPHAPNTRSPYMLLRREEIYEPFMQTYREFTAPDDMIYVQMHSASNVFKGKRRNFDIGILHAGLEPTEFEKAFIARLRQKAPRLKIEFQEPYDMRFFSARTLLHDLADRGKLGVCIEVNQANIGGEPVMRVAYGELIGEVAAELSHDIELYRRLEQRPDQTLVRRPG